MNSPTLRIAMVVLPLAGALWAALAVLKEMMG